MKNILRLFILFFSISLFAQITNKGKPYSWNNTINKQNIKTTILPKFDLKKLQAEDKINDNLIKPFRFGYQHKVNFGFNNGKWINLNNGDRIWLIKFHSKNALSLNFIFDKFYLPKGSKLYIYNESKTDLLGAYTFNNNNKHNSLGTWVVKGNTVWIEYYEPKKYKNKAKLHINTITHAYRNILNLGDSGDCNQDVNCFIGNDFEDIKNHTKKAVALILNNGSNWCSGALINNTNNDKKPYLLTANHCISNQNTANWVFRFGWISPNPICATTQESSNGNTNMQINGATIKASNLNSDFALLELNSNIPDAWNRTWSGWDKTDNIPNFVVGIHHPSGDIMKICRENDAVKKVFDNGSHSWEITEENNGWEIGVTESGSSGSPLFNENGNIIGQLYRGLAQCSGTVDNDKADQYGRFAVSWNSIAGNSNQLKPWLDPLNTNQDVLESLPIRAVYNNDAAISINTTQENCSSTEVKPSIIIRNNGINNLTSATINWNVDNQNNQIINWTGNLEKFQTETIPLETITLTNGSHVFNTTIENPNNIVDENLINNMASKNIEIKIFETTQIHLDLFTDDYCEETSWTLTDQNGDILYNGGPYPEDEMDNTLIKIDFNVFNNQCYTFKILDEGEDGICCNFGNGYFSLKTDDDTVIFTGNEFTNSQTKKIAISNNNNVFLDKVIIYPNPTNNVLNVKLSVNSAVKNYFIVNLLGQTILQGNLENTFNRIDISKLKKGIYFIQIDTIIKKFIVN